MTSQSGKQTIAMHILLNISRSKGNQRLKLGQLIEYNMRNIFLEKSYEKCVGETILRRFSKKSKLCISLGCANSRYSIQRFTIQPCTIHAFIYANLFTIYANMLFYIEINRDIKGSKKRNKRDNF